MKHWAWILLAPILIVTACGGGSGGIITKSESSGGEEALRQTVTTYVHAFLAGDSVKMYSYFHQGFQAKCEMGDLVAIMVLFQGLSGDLSDVEFRINGVDMQGNRAEIDGDLYLDGRPLNYFGGNEDDPYKKYWIFDDGKWWVTTDDPYPCEINGAAGRETPVPLLDD